MASLTARRDAAGSIAIGSVSSFQRSSAAVGVKPYAASFGVLPVAAKTELFK